MRRALIGCGSLTMGYGVFGVVADAQVNLVGVAVFALAVLVLHDVVLQPLVLLGGAAITRWVPAARRSAARFAATAGLAVTVVALPLVLGFGRTADNPTILPRPYGKALVVILVVIAVTALAGRKGIERSRNGRRGRPPR